MRIWHTGSTMQARPRFGERFPIVGRLEEAANGIESGRGRRRRQHHRVADALHEFGPGTPNGIAGRGGERVDKVDCGPVAVDVGQRGEPGEVDERDRSLGGHRAVSPRTWPPIARVGEPRPPAVRRAPCSRCTDF
jgi:hypothetical protein